MVEAAIVLPLLLLMMLSMIMLMLHDYRCYQAQVELHTTLMEDWDQSSAVFDIEKKKTETSSKISGMIDQWLVQEKEGRIYVFSPAKCIRLGEMFDFGTE